MKIIDKQLKTDEGYLFRDINDIGYLDGDVYYSPSYCSSLYVPESLNDIEKASNLYIEIKIKDIEAHNKECEVLCRKIVEEEE